MRSIKIIVLIAFAIATVHSRASFCKESIKPDPNAEQIDANDISQYYGFDEIEIIKFDNGISDLRIADFNGDRRNDIAIVNNRKAEIELLIQKGTVGPGETEVTVDPEDVDINTINPPSRFDKQSIPVSQKIHSFVCGDLNSDGMVDMAFYGEPKGLYIMSQKIDKAEADKLGTSPKTLSWLTRKKIEIDDGVLTSEALVCADLNNDGADDLALAGRDAVYVIVQKEDCSLAEPVKYPTASQALGLRVGDLNGDKINDLVLITNDGEKPIHVRFGLGTGKGKKGHSGPPPETAQLGPEEQFFIENPYRVEFANIDGVAGDEMLTVDGRSGRLSCYKLAPETQKDADWPILFYPLASGESDTKRDLAVADFDGDGLVDVVISDPGSAELIFYKQISGIGLAEPVRFPAFADSVCLCIADIVRNKKNKTELGILSVKEKVIGLSEFKDDRLSFPKPADVTGEPVAMGLSDIDHDGGTDCVYISRDVNDVRTLRVIYDLSLEGEAKANMSKASKPKPTKQVSETEGGLELGKLRSNPDGLQIVDVDQDGLDDVLVFVKYESPILVRQIQKRDFKLIDSPKAQASLIKDASLSSIAIANVDGRRGKELLVAQKNFARSLMFAEGESWSIIDQYNAKNTENTVSAVAAFDIDGKGPEDRPCILLLDGPKGQLQILKAGEDKTYRFEKELDIGKWDSAAAHLKMLFEPLTGGKAKSILLFDSKKFALITPPSGKSIPQHLEQQFSYATKIKDGVYGNLTAGDINFDGRTDIIMVEYKRDHIEILALDGDMKPVSALSWKIFEEKSYRGDRESGKSAVEPRELRIADVTGDAESDLVTVIHDRIIIYPQD